MDTDETRTIENADEAAWAAVQRGIVAAYLTREGVKHGGISLEPRWFVSPYVAVWAIRSMLDSDRVGWWAISGDVPTDYMASSHEHDAGDIQLAFASRWREAAHRMAQGQRIEGFAIGDPAQAKELAPLLAARANLLLTFGTHEKLRGDEDET